MPYNAFISKVALDVGGICTPSNAYGVAWSFGPSVDLSACNYRQLCKTAEPIEMPFGMWTRVGLGNYVLDGA